jgi:hypothetical protein
VPAALDVVFALWCPPRSAVQDARVLQQLAHVRLSARPFRAENWVVIVR